MTDSHIDTWNSPTPQEEVFLESYGMFAEGDLKYKRMISASTGARLTLFHTQRLSGEWLYSMHTYRECSWITEEFVEYQKQVIKNAKAFSDKFVQLGYHVVSGGTDNHLLLLDVL